MASRGAAYIFYNAMLLFKTSNVADDILDALEFECNKQRMGEML